MPDAPANLRATVAGRSVNLAWSVVTDAVDYVVVVGTSPGDVGMQMTNTTEPRFTFESMEPGTYYVSVHAHNWCGTGESSESVAFTVND